MDIARENLSKYLREIADRLDANTSEADEEQAMEVMKIFAHEVVSKERAAIEIKLSPSRFDALVREGKLPKGRKKLGYKELRWYLDEVIECAKKYKLGKYK